MIKVWNLRGRALQIRPIQAEMNVPCRAEQFPCPRSLTFPRGQFGSQEYSERNLYIGSIF